MEAELENTPPANTIDPEKRQKKIVDLNDRRRDLEQELGSFSLMIVSCHWQGYAGRWPQRSRLNSITNKSEMYH